MFIRSILVTLSMFATTPVYSQNIIVIGDSIMDWNGPNSIPAQLSQELGLPVDDRSVAGAQISSSFWERAQGLDIRAQLDGDRSDILVMTGGGNDLALACGCAEDCDEEVDVLLSRDGSGELGDFLQDVVADGTQIFVLEYALPPSGGNEFTGCVPDLHVLSERIDAMPGVTHVPVRHKIDPTDFSFYDEDRIHPSVKGASVMAELLAAAIIAAQ